MVHLCITTVVLTPFLLFFFYFYWISAFPSVREEIGKSKIRDDPEGWYREGGGRREDSGWGTRGHLGRIHVDIWQNQYNIVKLKNKIKFKKKKRMGKKMKK